MLLGTRGGDFQPQTLLQMASYMRWAGLAPAAAHLEPRWATEEWPRDDPAVVVEPHLDETVISALEAKGHNIRRSDAWMSGWGPVSVIQTDGAAAVGAADPRGAATAAYTV